MNDDDLFTSRRILFPLKGVAAAATSNTTTASTSGNDRMIGKKVTPNTGVPSSTGKKLVVVISVGEDELQVDRRDGRYHSRTTDDVFGDMMLPAVLPRRAAKEQHDGLAEAVRANPDDGPYMSALPKIYKTLRLSGPLYSCWK
jgi:hypothetical protein